MKTKFYDPNAGRTYSSTGNTFRTPEGHFGIVGKNGNAYFPGGSNPPRALPKYSGPAPVDMSNRNTFRGTSKPVLNMKPNGSYTVMPHRAGQSLPGYVGKPYNPRGVNAVGRYAALLGRVALGRHPVVRGLNMAFEVANALDWSGEWVITDPGTPPVPVKYDWSGFAKFGAGWQEKDWVSCFNASMDWSGPGGVGGSRWPATPGGTCTPGYSHVNQWFTDGPPPDLADQMLEFNSTGTQWRYLAVEFGGANGREIFHRHEMKMKTNAARWRANSGSFTIPYPQGIRIPLITIPGRTAVRMPVVGLAPPPPVLQEKFTTPPRVKRRVLPKYATPTVTAEFMPGRARIPPSTPPHLRLPPPGNVRERKTRATRSTALGLIASFYDLTTETKEVVDILYNNLGKKCPGARGIGARSDCIWKNLGTLDVGNAVLELAKNHYEDKVYGRVFGTIGKHTPFGSMTPGTSPSRDFGPVKKR